MDMFISAALAPVRSEPAHQSDMVTQLLPGEAFQIIEEHGDWRYIICHFDGYKGWIDKKIVTEIPEGSLSPKLVVDKFITLVDNANHQMVIPAGSYLWPSANNQGYRLAGSDFRFEGTLSGNIVYPTGNNVVNLARNYIYSPYLWGGRTFMGIDCSGLTQLIYKLIGINLPRDASQQVMQGEIVSFIEESQAGDLAFFEDDTGKIVHTGIITGNNTIIHSSGWVRIDTIDNQGIFNLNTGKYSHYLRVIKRILKQ